MTGFGIPQKFIAVGVLTLAINAALAGAGLWIAGSLGGRLEEGVGTTSAVRNHLTADMMHDALRGDVLAALDAVHRNDAAAKAAIQADLEEHAATFRESVAANKALSLPASVEKLLGSLDEPLNAYIEQAATLVNGLLATGAQRPDELQSSRERFSRLETLMSEVSDAIEAAVKDAQGHGASEAALARIVMFAGLGLAAVFSLLSFLYSSGGIATPIVRISRAMTALAQAERNVEIPFAERADEIGDLARAAQSFRDAQETQKAHDAEQRQRKDRVAHDLRDAEAAQKVREAEQHARAEETARQVRREALRGFAESFDRGVSELIKSVTAATSNLGTLAQQLESSARLTDDRTSALVEATTRAAGSVDAVSGATRQMSSAVQEIARQVTDSQGLSTRAVDDVERANLVVEELAQAAEKIGDVLGMINDIAAQTNLLALNATIEAARAGEAGKGFAVVASEVKSLANQTAKLTEEVSAQIAAIQSSSGEVSSVIKQVKERVANISESSAAIGTKVEEQGASTREITQQIDEMSRETKEISSNCGSVAESFEQTQEAASAIQKASEGLRALSGQLRTQVDKFLTDLQAA